MQRSSDKNLGSMYFDNFIQILHVDPTFVFSVVAPPEVHCQIWRVFSPQNPEILTRGICVPILSRSPFQADYFNRAEPAFSSPHLRTSLLSVRRREFRGAILHPRLRYSLETPQPAAHQMTFSRRIAAPAHICVLGALARRRHSTAVHGCGCFRRSCPRGLYWGDEPLATHTANDDIPQICFKVRTENTTPSENKGPDNSNESRC